MTKVMFSIGEVAELLSITPKAIRHYHKIGLVEEPERNSNNYRYYTIEQIEQIQEVLRLKSFGLSLNQISIILQARDTDRLTRSVLQQREQKVRFELMHLQQQLDNIRNYLASESNPLDQVTMNMKPYNSVISTTSILADSIKPISNGLSDIIIAVEGDIFSKFDTFPQDYGYDEFVHEVGQQLAKKLIKQESLFIFWMERYLALSTMEEGDLQGNSWLSELDTHIARKFVASTLQLPILPQFSEARQKHIQKLFFALLVQNSTGLQSEFIRLLIDKK